MIGLYGGTFDPVHNGHIHAALSVQRALSLDAVQLVLAARPGHRKPPHASLHHRWQMLCLAVQPHAQLLADDREMHRQGHSYTIDTLTEFSQQHADVVPVWILGQDAFATLAEWHRWQELLTWCNLAVVERPGELRSEPPVMQKLWRQYGVESLQMDRKGQIVRLHLPMQEVSATGIRHKIATGERYEHLLAAPVSTYIKAHHLYTTLHIPR